MFSNDYCYKRLKEAESFFRTHYNVENDYLELSEIEKKFPEKDNLFYKTIMVSDMSERMRGDLLDINKNLYCRAVFSDFFKLIKEEGVEHTQQIPFVFITCKTKANIKIKANTGFAACVNHFIKSPDYTVEKFNALKQKKIKNPELEILPKYREILEKYEVIL